MLGGIAYTLFGVPGFYLIPALAFVGLLGLLYSLTGKQFSAIPNRLWIISVVAAALLFYALTFWEHGLALVFLVPLFALILAGIRSSTHWFLAGISFGISSGLRPETILLYPLLWLMPHPQSSRKARLLLFSLGTVISFAGLICLEKMATGCWLSAQVPANLGLLFSGTDLVSRYQNLFNLFLSSPLPIYIYGNALLMLLLLTLVRKNAYIPAVGLPLFAIAGMVWAYVTHGSAFAITASSQGLFFALPWIGITLLPVPDLKRHRDPLFILGWGYIFLAFLLSPDEPGMHWGPRFLFPALLPLALHASIVLARLPKQRARVLIFLTVLAALIYASGPVLAVSERGRAGREVREAVSRSQCGILILERWHEGADLEPIWSSCSPLWAKGQGSLEELLLQLEKHGITERIGWLSGMDEGAAASLPLDITARYPLPDKAGWRGELRVASLAPLTDVRWGELYRHAGRRRAEQNHPEEAKACFERAVEILPSDADVRYDLAICLGKMGLDERAVEVLRETLRIDPDHQAARTLMDLLGDP